MNHPSCSSTECEWRAVMDVMKDKAEPSLSQGRQGHGGEGHKEKGQWRRLECWARLFDPKSLVRAIPTPFPSCRHGGRKGEGYKWKVNNNGHPVDLMKAFSISSASLCFCWIPLLHFQKWKEMEEWIVMKKRNVTAGLELQVAVITLRSGATQIFEDYFSFVIQRLCT